MRRISCLIVSIIVIFSVFLCLGTFEIRNISNAFLRILWSNFNSIATMIYTLVPLIILLILVLLFIANKWALRVEKMSIGGCDILFDNPTKLYRRKIKNYLDTKRTIFKIDYNYDNFFDTLNSYFEIYRFFRDKSKILGKIKNKNIKFSRNKESANLYDLTNQTIQILNEFLTKNQSNYRRWYKYMELTAEKAFYLTPIGELQKQYPYYKDLCCCFEEVNSFFVDIIAREFDVDIAKWNIEQHIGKI